MERPQTPPLRHRNSSAWYPAATAVILVDIAQVIPYGVHELTVPIGDLLNPWEWALTLAFALVSLAAAVAVFTDRPRVFAEAVYLSGGLYAITTITLLSSLIIPANARFMLGILCAGVMLGLFTLWFALRRAVPS